MRPTTERIEIKYVLDCPLHPRVTPTKLYCDVKKKQVLYHQSCLQFSTVSDDFCVVSVYLQPGDEQKSQEKQHGGAQRRELPRKVTCVLSHSIKENIKFYRQVCLRPVQIGRPKNIGSLTKIYGNIIACTLLHYCHRHKTQCILRKW